MASDSSSDPAVNRPLWVIAFSLAIIAICLLLLVVQVQLREEPRNLEKPASSAQESAINTESAPQPRLFRRSAAKTFPGVQSSAAPLAEQGASAGETLVAPYEPPAPVPPKAASQNSGGYAPLSYLGQTNYQTAIVGKVVLHGTPPAETPIDAAGNTACTGPDGEPLTTRFFVVGPDGQLADTLVFIRGSSLQPTHPTSRTQGLVFTNCMIEPYVSAIMAYDEVIVRNPGGTIHSLRAGGAHGDSFGETLKPGAIGRPHRLSQADPFVRFRCEVHPWEFAYVSVFGNPFFAVTDKRGAFTITNVPPGEYVLEAVHRKATGTNTVSHRITVNAHEVTSADFVIEAP